MIAKFDSFRRFESPLLYVCNPGCVLSGSGNKLLSNVAGILTDTSDAELLLNFNAPSELNFRAYKVRRDDPEETSMLAALYRYLKNRRLIYLDDIGFFMISQVEESYSDGVYYKDIRAESCEVELRNKGLPYIEDGTYKFYTGDAGDPGLIEKIMRTAPLWDLGEIDVSVQNRWRTFEDVDIDANILGFMLENMQDAYECIFEFDIMHRIVNVYDQANYVHMTDIHITNEDLINSLDITESSEDLYTALSVRGENDLGIDAVNPIGTDVIYNFDYYLDWMDPALSAKVSAWQDLVDEKSGDYYSIQLSRYNNLTQRSTLQLEYEKFQTQYNTYNRCRENMVAEADYSDIAEYNEIIIKAGGVPIPETPTLYTWVKFADNSAGSGITDDPNGKMYIGLAYDKGTEVASINPLDYEWHTFRSGETFPRTSGGTTVYTWVVFGTSPTSGMGSDPDGKNYIGIALDRSSATKSTDYSTYTWQLMNIGNIGIPQILARITVLAEDALRQMADVQEQIDDLDEIIEEQTAEVDEIHEMVAMDSYFTAQELAELSNYISEGNMTDEYITVTESMSYAERFSQMKTLYDRGVKQLEKISTPTQEFSVDVENFIFVKDFEQWSAQLETGCLINVEIEEGDIAQLFLSSMTVNYEDRKLSMTFGNRYNRFDAKSLFEDVLGGISKTANTLSYIKDTIYPLKDGTFNRMKEAVETSRTLTKNSVLSSNNEQVTIDNTGYTGRRLLPDGTIDPKQIKINGRNIVFTDDAWETCKTAIGEILLGDDASAYGINAEILLGNIIMGNELHIVNSDGEDMFQVTEDNVVIRVGREFAKKEDTISDVDVEYCRSTSNVSPLDPETITVDWNTVAPEWVNGEYVWQRTVTTYADEETVISDATCLTGAAGEKGEGISSSVIEYAVSESGSTPPSDGWLSLFPASIGEGEFLWTRTTLTYDDGTSSQSYTVSANAIGISSIQEEYYLSSSDSEPTGGSWAETPPAWNTGSYIWTRSRILWEDGTETTTTPVLNSTWNNIGATLDDCVTDIEINKTGIQQNTVYYQDLYNKVSKIQAYIQTGVISVDAEGKTSYGVKIGETLSSVDVYIRSGSTAFSSGWLSTEEGGSALTPEESVLYTIKTPGSYYGKVYRWNNTDDLYEETSSDGTLSSIFTSSELGFYDTGEKTAYFSNKNLNVKTVRTNKILLSSDVIQDTDTNNWQIGIDRGFYLKWIGTSGT